jgi:cell division septum initiation protein DivIVA
MDHEPRSSAPSAGFPAYSLHGVERFLVTASEHRGRLLQEIEAARQRVSDTRAELASTSDVELRLSRMVLEANRVLRGERQANDKAIAAIAADAESEAERILAGARTQVAALQASASRVERTRRAAPTSPQVTASNRRIEERAAALRRIL